jgi:parallel beta-helix repeat protein
MRRLCSCGVFVVRQRATSRTATTLSLWLLFGAIEEAESSVRRVPQDYSTIQAAINAAQDGDTVLVSRGTYAGGLVISGKTITLASKYVDTGDPNDIAQTIIGGGNPILTIQSSAGAGTTVQGLTFLNGGHQLVNRARRVDILNNRFLNGNDQVSFESAGGLVRDCFFDGAGDDGIDADRASDPTIEGNTILNSANDGIEIRLHSYTGSTLRITIRGNLISGAREDGIQLIDYPGLSSRLFRIERNVIVDNAMVGLGCMRDGISNEDFRGAPLEEEVQVVNNTFSRNPHGLTGGDRMLVMNNIFEGSADIGVKRVAGSSLVIDNDFWNNGTDYTGSNVDVGASLFQDPLLDANYELQAGSPCIDAGTASIVWNGHTVAAPPHVGAAPDLGAREAGAGSGGTLRTVSFQDGVSPEASYAGTRDTDIAERDPSSNFGSADVLRVDGGIGRVFSPPMNWNLSALLKWDLASIPSGSLVQAVRLTIFVTDSSADPYQVYELRRPWVEDQATWQRADSDSEWSVAGAKGGQDRRWTVLGTVSASAAGSYTLTLNGSGLGMVQSWVESPSANNGIILARAKSSDALVFSSRQASTPANRPKLTVTYLPPSQ